MKSIHILALAMLCICSCAKMEDLQEKNLDVAKKQSLLQIKYGPKTRHTLNITLPANRDENTPVIIFIHGGAWLFGDKNVHDIEISQYANAGFACATINYRYASDITNIHYEDLLSDVRLAIDFIASKSELYQVSNSRFGLAGQSAGAHLALCTSYTMNSDKKIKAVVSWAGPVNLLDADQLQIAGAKLIAKNLLGHALQTRQDSLLYMDASPFYQLHDQIPPTLLIQGTEDIAVPYSSVNKFYSRLKNLGEQHEMLTLQNKGHLWSGQTLDLARDHTLEYFKKHL